MAKKGPDSTTFEITNQNQTTGYLEPSLRVVPRKASSRCGCWTPINNPSHVDFPSVHWALQKNKTNLFGGNPPCAHFIFWFQLAGREGDPQTLRPSTIPSPRVFCSLSSVFPLSLLYPSAPALSLTGYMRWVRANRALPPGHPGIWGREVLSRAQGPDMASGCKRLQTNKSKPVGHRPTLSVVANCWWIDRHVNGVFLLSGQHLYQSIY